MVSLFYRKKKQRAFNGLIVTSRMMISRIVLLPAGVSEINALVKDRLFQKLNALL